MSPKYSHTPVMLEEVMDALLVAPGGRYCDGTVGLGGHSEELLRRSGPDGVVVGFDRDRDALHLAQERLAACGDRLWLRHGNFADLARSLHEMGMAPVDGILLDLGVSSMQLDRAERGFRFSSDGPLDMRLDQEEGASAAELIARLKEKELARILMRFGEEPKGRKVARAIKKAQSEGQLLGTTDLARVISDALGGRGPRRSQIHPATRSFMALRMAVNDELGSLERILDSFTEALRPGGRVAIIAFHSLEDRAVKQAFRRLANPCVCPPSLPVCGCNLKPSLTVITRRPLRPSDEEQRENPRSRSAKLRVAERI